MLCFVSFLFPNLDLLVSTLSFKINLSFKIRDNQVTKWSRQLDETCTINGRQMTIKRMKEKLLLPLRMRDFSSYVFAAECHPVPPGTYRTIWMKCGHTQMECGHVQQAPSDCRTDPKEIKNVHGVKVEVPMKWSMP